MKSFSVLYWYFWSNCELNELVVSNYDIHDVKIVTHDSFSILHVRKKTNIDDWRRYLVYSCLPIFYGFINFI